MSSGEAATPFGELARYVEIPRVAGLRLAPDGSWLAAEVQTLGADRKKYVSSIWRLPAAPGDETAPRRLTWSEDGESTPGSRPTGRCCSCPGAPVSRPGRTTAKQPTRAPCGGCRPVVAKRSGWRCCRVE